MHSSVDSSRHPTLLVHNNYIVQTIVTVSTSKLPFCVPEVPVQALLCLSNSSVHVVD